MESFISYQPNIKIGELVSRVTPCKVFGGSTYFSLKAKIWLKFVTLSMTLSVLVHTPYVKSGSYSRQNRFKSVRCKPNCRLIRLKCVIYHPFLNLL